METVNLLKSGVNNCQPQTTLIKILYYRPNKNQVAGIGIGEESEKSPWNRKFKKNAQIEIRIKTCVESSITEMDRFPEIAS